MFTSGKERQKINELAADVKKLQLKQYNQRKSNKMYFKIKTEIIVKRKNNGENQQRKNCSLEGLI